jgi:hypothetical protein
LQLIRSALVGALSIAALSTLGDFVWAGLRLQHRVIFGLSHGALLFLAIGAYLGFLDRQPARGALAGAAIGLAAAGTFYLLAPIAGYGVMFLVWAFIWCALAVLRRALSSAAHRWTWRETLIRAGVAMIGSGVGFYLISGIWRPFDPAGWDYAVHFLSWTFAYLPGFVALLGRRPMQTSNQQEAT